MRRVTSFPHLSIYYEPTAGEWVSAACSLENWKLLVKLGPKAIKSKTIRKRQKDTTWFTGSRVHSYCWSKYFLLATSSVMVKPKPSWKRSSLEYMYNTWLSLKCIDTDETKCIPKTMNNSLKIHTHIHLFHLGFLKYTWKRLSAVLTGWFTCCWHNLGIRHSVILFFLLLKPSSLSFYDKCSILKFSSFQLPRHWFLLLECYFWQHQKTFLFSAGH